VTSQIRNVYFLNLQINSEDKILIKTCKNVKDVLPENLKKYFRKLEKNKNKIEWLYAKETTGLIQHFAESGRLFL